MGRSSDNTPIYMTTVVPGLEDIACQEMCTGFPLVNIVGKSRGKVLFSYGDFFKNLFTLKCVDNIYLYLGSFNIGAHKADLTQIPGKIKGLNVVDKISQINNDIKNKKIIVSASRSGKHTYSRFDVADAVLDALLKHCFFNKGTIKQHDFAFRIDVNEDNACLYCKLTPASFRFRGKDRGFLSGALKSSIAHAMVLISEPDSTDVFFDPFCGSGTIPYERSFYDAYAILASDISSERLKVAKRNLPEYIGINCWDACHTELLDNSVTKIVSNLPWGKQNKVKDVNRLYIDFLREANRILTQKGKIVLLTDQEDALCSGAESNNLIIKKVGTISLHGLHPSIFLLQK